MTATTTRTPVVASDIFGRVLTLNFATGQELAVDLDKLSPDILTQAALHGLKQKLVDAAAIARDPTTGLSATPEDKYQAVKAVFDRITRADGTWNAVREGEQRAQGGMFVRAIMELTSKTREETTAMLEKLDKDQIAALKKNAKVLDITQRMEREAAAAKPDNSDDLLAALAGGVLGTPIVIDSALLVDARASERKPAKGKK